MVNKGGPSSDKVSALNDLLKSSFPYIRVEELRSIPLNALARLCVLHNKRVRAHQQTASKSTRDVTREGRSMASMRRRKEKEDALIRYDAKHIKEQRASASLYRVQPLKIQIKTTRDGEDEVAGITRSREEIDIPKDYLQQLSEIDDAIWDCIPLVAKQQIFLELDDTTNSNLLRRKCWPLIRAALKPLEARAERWAMDLVVVNVNDSSLNYAPASSSITATKSDSLCGELDPSFFVAGDFGRYQYRNGLCETFDALIALIIGEHSRKISTSKPTSGAGAAAAAAASRGHRGNGSSARRSSVASVDRMDLQMVPMYQALISLIREGWDANQALNQRARSKKKSTNVLCSLRNMMCMKIYDESVGPILVDDVMSQVISSADSFLSRVAPVSSDAKSKAKRRHTGANSARTYASSEDFDVDEAIPTSGGRDREIGTSVQVNANEVMNCTNRDHGVTLPGTALNAFRRVWGFVDAMEKPSAKGKRQNPDVQKDVRHTEGDGNKGEETDSDDEKQSRVLDAARLNLLRDLRMVVLDSAMFNAICASLMHSVEKWAGVEMSLNEVVKESEADAPKETQPDLPPDDSKLLVTLLTLALDNELVLNAGGLKLPVASEDLLLVVLPAIKSVILDRLVGMIQRRIAHEKKLVLQRKKKLALETTALETQETPSSISKTSIRTRIFNVLRATPSKAEAGPTRSALARVTSRVGRCCWCAAILRCAVVDDERGTLSMLAILNDVVVDDQKSTENDDNVVAYSGFEMFGITLAKLVYQKLRHFIAARGTGGMKRKFTSASQTLNTDDGIGCGGFTSSASLSLLLEATVGKIFVRLAESSSIIHAMTVKILTLIARASPFAATSTSTSTSTTTTATLFDVKQLLSVMRALATATKSVRNEYKKKFLKSRLSQKPKSDATDTAKDASAGSVAANADTDILALYKDLISAANANPEYKKQLAESDAQKRKESAAQPDDMGETSTAAEQRDVVTSLTCPGIVTWMKEIAVVASAHVVM